MKAYKESIFLTVIGLVFMSFTLFSWLMPKNDFSESERRPLAPLPTLSAESLLDGSYMSAFERFTQDRFPMRDALRTVKAVTAYRILGLKDNNGLYLEDGCIAKLDYPLNQDSISHAADRFGYIYDRYLADKDLPVYLSIVPDKGYFLAEENGYPSMDYDRLFSLMKQYMPYARYIDITDTLDISDYYRTDTHWRQEKLLDTAGVITEAMGAEVMTHYDVQTLPRPFRGVYSGQASIPLPAETLFYLTNDVLARCVVTNHETGRRGGIYDMEKAAGSDPYEIFLSGALPLLTIENPAAAGDRELIIFRDSFGSSLAPLLAESYSRITLIDIRYLRADFLDRFVSFEGADVLFLYSTLVLNNSETLT